MSNEIPKEEERWFQQREMERREEIRRRLEEAAEKARERREMGSALGTSDEALLERLQALSFDADTARVFDLLPLVHVAWADGTVTTAERAAILEILEARGIQGHEQAFLLIEALLEKRPSEEFLEETLEILAGIASNNQALVQDIANFSVAVADASGGFFGFGNRISDAERALIDRIAGRLGEPAQQAFQTALQRRVQG